MAEGSAESHLVVVGSSAGGIEALSLFVGGLPDDFGAPIVLAQHLDPSRPSRLGDILARRTSLTVVTIQDHADLEPGTIYVVPANRDVEVTDHAVRLREPVAEPHPAPSVDRLMASAAEIFGERLIAVVLTGTGSDGADGARRVKEAGGTVLIQDPEEARFPSMPDSLEPTIVDLVVRVEALGPLLHDLIRGAYRPLGSDDDKSLARFLDSVRHRTGIDFSRYKRETILRRLQRRMAAVRVERLSDYARYVASHPEEYQRLVGSFLIKVTDFFRDAELFDHLRDVILPDLIEAARNSDRELRIWCAGCATGEEAYSLAILVAELLEEDLDAWTVRIFATDLDGEAIAFARRGLYRSSALEGLPAELVDRHFTRLDGQYEVRKHLRVMTVFGEHDLAMRAPFPRIDLAFCRNVLIYFTPELQERALQLFAFSVREGGFLVLGKAETTTPLPVYFAPHEGRLRIARRRATPSPVPPSQLARASGGRAPQPQIERLGRQRSRPAASAAARPDRTAAGDEALAALPVGVVLVDQGYLIRTMNPAARRLLGIHSSAIGQDLLHLVDRLPAGALRLAIDAALRGEEERVVLRVLGPRPPDEDPGAVEVACYPARDGMSRRAALLVREVSPETDGATATASPTGEGPPEAKLASALAENRRLARANEELANVAVDLRSANEEMLVANEETQAATEEVETLNEELQATNEELETLNEELQATIEELDTTSEDMQARAIELQHLATHLDEQRRVSETERLRLELLVQALVDAVAMIEPSGQAVVKNETYATLFEERGLEPLDDEGRPLPGGDLRSRVAAGEQFLLQFAAVQPDGRRRWYEAYGRPLEGESRTGGGILVVHDTTDLSLRRLQEEFVGIVAHELRTPLTALRGYLQLLRRRVADADDARLVSLALPQAERLGRLVDELFDVTRADTGRLNVNPEPVQLRSIIEESVEIAQSLSDQRIIVEGLDDSLVEVDGPRIQQVLLNVLTNAQRHASRSPTVTLRVRRQRRWLSLEVEDHGPGMPDDVREALFSRFHVDPNSPGRGLGLGLYVSREIVRAHGGTIEADSAPGEGTIFTIRLPLSRLARDGQKPTLSSRSKSGSNGADGADGSRDGERPRPKPEIVNARRPAR